jgi:cyclopropane-fatty-acyl-phospholipid synthase
VSTETTRDAIPRPTEHEWPGLASPPHSPLRATVAERLLRRAVRRLPIAVEYPDGTRIGSGGDVPVMRLHEPANLYHRLGVDGTIGFGEAYLVGDWSTDSLVELLIPLAANVDSLIPKPLRAFRRFTAPRKPDRENNTVTGARQNIERHYDLSNEMFAVFLDDTMTYSSAFFESDTEDLGAAQVRKIDAILDYAGVGDGTRLLEIGTGWGALSVRAARRGARVTSLTISPRQKELAEQRAREAGVADRVEVVLRDYRHETGSYDAVASVEMIEAVGHQHWRDYFAMVDRVLEPGGRFALQAITMPHKQMLATTRSQGWPHKYIFPGGELLSIPAIEEQVAGTRLGITDRRELGASYARTLQLWRERFLSRWSEVAELGFDETFRRMWQFYLAYFEAGFRAGYLNVWQLRMDKS